MDNCTETICKITNLHKAFRSTQVLKGVDIEIKKGEVVAILGPSGSGKTTLLRCLNFLEHADQGTILIDGCEVNCENVTRKEIAQLRKKATMVFQNYNLFKNKTLLENCIEGPVHVQKVPVAEATAKALELIERVGLTEKKDQYPAELSGGQQQRGGIARSLLMNPSVLLLDEPTSALDPEMVGEVLDTIREVAETGITMIIVTHAVAFARDVADRVIFMDGGVVVEEGPAKEVVLNPQHDRTRKFLSSLLNDGASGLDPASI